MSHSDFLPRRFVLGEFATVDAMLEGTTKMREKGFKKLDTHTPYPVHGIEEALGLGRPKIPTIVLCAAITGMCLAYSMMYFMNASSWSIPGATGWVINVANRPPHSPPAFVPITFELAILLGGCSSFFGVLALMKLPKPYHPVFQSERFTEKASIDGFFLSMELELTGDPQVAQNAMKEFGATHVELIEEVER